MWFHFSKECEMFAGTDRQTYYAVIFFSITYLSDDDQQLDQKKKKTLSEPKTFIKMKLCYVIKIIIIIYIIDYYYGTY